MNIWTALAAGLAAGGLHVLAGPDHLAAIGALSSGHRERHGLLGFRWGSGHALGVLLVGLAAIGLRSLADLAPLERWGEVLVGVSLVVAGLRAIVSWRRPSPASPRWAAAFGALHGVAGGSHLWGTLPALALPAHGPAQAYLAAFCVSSIVVMTAAAAALGRVAGSREKPWALAAGSASILIGIGWAAYALA